MISVVENYRGYHPPCWVRASIERLLASLSAEHLGGLRSVVLTSSEAIGRGKTGRVHGRKYERKECRGFYHRAKRNEQAWIEIVVDSTVNYLPAFLLKFNFVRDLFLAGSLYHEVGHHLDATVGSASRGGEAAAEDWRRRLTKIHVRRLYWYLLPLLALLRQAFRLVRPRIERAAKASRDRPANSA